MFFEIFLLIHNSLEAVRGIVSDGYLWFSAADVGKLLHQSNPYTYAKQITDLKVQDVVRPVRGIHVRMLNLMVISEDYAIRLTEDSDLDGPIQFCKVFQNKKDVYLVHAFSQRKPPSTEARLVKRLWPKVKVGLSTDRKSISAEDWLYKLETNVIANYYIDLPMVVSGSTQRIGPVYSPVYEPEQNDPSPPILQYSAASPTYVSEDPSPPILDYFPTTPRHVSEDRLQTCPTYSPASPLHVSEDRSQTCPAYSPASPPHFSEVKFTFTPHKIAPAYSPVSPAYMPEERFTFTQHKIAPAYSPASPLNVPEEPHLSPKYSPASPVNVPEEPHLSPKYSPASPPNASEGMFTFETQSTCYPMNSPTSTPNVPEGLHMSPQASTPNVPEGPHLSPKNSPPNVPEGMFTFETQSTSYPMNSPASTPYASEGPHLSPQASTPNVSNSSLIMIDDMPPQKIVLLYKGDPFVYLISNVQ